MHGEMKGECENILGTFFQLVQIVQPLHLYHSVKYRDKMKGYVSL